MSQALQQFWQHRGGLQGFETWRKTGKIPRLLVRVVAPHFVAGFEIDDEVRRTAPILKRMLGMTEQQARAYIKAKGWRATVMKENARA